MTIIREVTIGNCRLIQGDCLAVMPTLGKVGCIITDPPFEAQAHTAIRRTQRSIKTGEAAALKFGAITEDTRTAIPQWAADNCEGWMLAFCQVEAVAAWRDAMEAAGLKYKRGMAWVKPDSSPQFNGQMPAQGFECIAAAWCGDGVSRWNGGGKRGVFTHLTNWAGRHGVHETEKPVPLMEDLVSLFSLGDGDVLDCFMGSGTTGVACVNLGRSFIGIELDPGYFDIAVKRITDAHRQADFFVDKPAPVKAEQGSLL